MGSIQTLSRVLPGSLVYRLNVARRSLFPSPRQRREIALLAAAGNPGSVLQGPFKGMRYVKVGAATSPICDILGLYETELQDAVERLVARNPDVVVDIGTATGYYAVGMATRLPRARVVGFDINPYARAVTRALAALNGVGSRVETRGACDPAGLQGALERAARPVVISDCEGYEDVVLDPAAVPALRSAAVLVELHDMFVSGVSDRIRKRFEATHQVERIEQRPRTGNELPPGTGLSPEQAIDAMNEGRGEGFFWYFMTPRARPA